MRDLTVLWPEGGLYDIYVWRKCWLWRYVRGSAHLEEFFRNLGEGGGSRWSWSFGSWSDWCMVHMGALAETKYTVKSTKLLFPLFPYGNLVPQSICDWLKSVAFTTGKYCSKVCLEPKITPNYLLLLSIWLSVQALWNGKSKSVKRTDQSWMETVCVSYLSLVFCWVELWMQKRYRAYNHCMCIYIYHDTDATICIT